jgi:hypothetical protein
LNIYRWQANEKDQESFVGEPKIIKRKAMKEEERSCLPKDLELNTGAAWVPFFYSGTGAASDVLSWKKQENLTMR